VTLRTERAGKPLPRAPGVGRKTLTVRQTRERDARRTLAAAGLDECVIYSFIDGAHAALFGGGGEALRLDNPISSEMSHMRPSPLPGLLAAAARNQAQGAMDLGLFEIGAGYHGGEPGEQASMAAAIRVGGTAPRHWSGTRQPVDVFHAKADAEAVLAALGIAVDRAQIARDVPGWLHPGQAGVFKLGPKVSLGLFGALHPKVLQAFGIKGSAVAMLIDLEALPAPKAKGPARPALDVSNFQAVERDFAFVVEERVEAAAITRAAEAADKALIDRVEVFDLFAGRKAAEQLGAGKKSVAISVHLQPRDKTLTDAEIEAVAEKIVANVAKATGAVLRG